METLLIKNNLHRYVNEADFRLKEGKFKNMLIHRIAYLHKYTSDERLPFAELTE